MLPTQLCPRHEAITNDEQVYNELLGAADLDPAGQVWGHLGHPAAHQLAHPLPSLLPLAIDAPAPSAPPALLAPRYDPVPAPMAAPPFDSTFPGESLFNIHADVNPAPRPPTPAAPHGECNFLFYNPGANPVKCGCRRFWSSNAGPMTVGDAIATDPYVCKCNHHACYHDHQAKPAQASAATPAPDNDKAKAGREALTPLQDISFRFTPGLPTTLDFPELDNVVEAANNAQGVLGAGLGLRSQIQASPGPDGSLPDTLCWGDNRQSPGNRISTLPPIPSQCLMPSRPSSVAESSQSRYLRPFAGRGMQTLSGVRDSQKGRKPLQERTVDTEPAMAKVVEEPRDDTQQGLSQPLEKPMSPGFNPSQDLGDTQPFVSSGLPRETARNLTDAIEAHDQRLDRLENVSFSVAGHEECTDKHEQMDLRVTELESRVGEVERGMNDNSSYATARAARSDRFDGSTCSEVSEATNATARPLHSFEIRSQFQSMEAQISRLQAALPATFDTPWEVEVVFLPFPLRKVWQEAHEFKGESNAASDEWTQLPNTCSAAANRAQSPFGGDWARGHDFEWLLPKACGPRSLVDRRLRSRGLVRTISVKGPDARSVQAAMSAVFGGAMRDMRAAAQSRSRRRSAPGHAAQFFGLANDWVPLRKIHKDSRLRFLPPAEMVTPALWDVQFLSSVAMRAAEPRLFVTQPEAYAQDALAYEAGWTWRRLRELPRFYGEGGTPGSIPEADALEEHWAFNEVLDEKPGTSRSGTPALPNAQHMASSPSQPYFTTVESMFRSTPSRGTTPAPRPRKKPQLPNIRTGTAPSPVPFISPSTTRRVVSGGSDRQVMTGAITKRRTRSPSRARFTPRWSTKSPSPALGAPRGTTPFNYATPYSNGPAEPHPAYVAGQQADSGDDGFDIDIFDDGSFYDYEDDGGESLDSVEVVPRLVSSNSHPLPEDEPWPGIEDGMSDGENVDPREVDGEGDSEMSSQPSEYPSTQAWNGAAGFRIHED